MKSFLRRSGLYIFFCLGIIIITYFSVNFFLHFNGNFRIALDKEILILGHSHPLLAYNDTIIPFTKNMAGAAESYFYTYAKTRKILEQNPQINTVLIECSNNQFSKAMDEWTWGKMSNRLHLYGPFLNFKETILLFSKRPTLFIESTSILFRKSFEKILSSDYDYIKKIGGYKRGEGSLEREPQVKTLQSRFEISENNIETLKELILFLHSRDVNVYLIRTPTLKAYYSDYSETQYQKIINSEFSEIDFLDFSDFQMKYSNYADSQHMNYMGSQEYSEWFSTLLKKGLLQKKNKQIFIDNELKKRIQSK